MLGIDLNYASQQQKHVDIKFIDKDNDLLQRIRHRARENAIDKYPLLQQLDKYRSKEDPVGM